MQPDPEGEIIQGFLFSSEDLPQMWKQLDGFEGADYHRTPIRVECDKGECIEAYIYALAPNG